MIDWDGLAHGPTMGVFGEPVDYTPVGGALLTIAAVFDDAFLGVGTGFEPAAISSQPRLGVQVSQMPAGWSADDAQNDTFTVQRTGVTYVVKAGKADSHGWALLEAQKAAA